MIYFDRVEVVNILDPTHGKPGLDNLSLLSSTPKGVKGLEKGNSMKWLLIKKIPKINLVCYFVYYSPQLLTSVDPTLKNI